MNPRLLAQSGVRVEEEFRFEFLSLPEGPAFLLVACLLMLLAAAVVLMYRHEGRSGAPLRRRMVLAGIRVAVLLVLALVAFEPVLARYIHRWVDSYTLVLIDTSASMDLVDRYRDGDAAARVRNARASVTGGGQASGAGAGNASAIAPVEARRSELVRAVLQAEGRAFLNELTAHNRVKVYSFDQACKLGFVLRSARERPSPRPRPGEVAELDESRGAGAALGVAEASLDFPARGPVTDIHRAFRQSLEAQGDAPLAGIVVISDGGFNHGGGVDAVAPALGQRRVPVFTVGIGDPSAARNLAVAELGAPSFVFPSDPFALTVTVAAEGLTGDSAHILIREQPDGASGQGQVIAERRVPIPGDGRLPVQRFEHQQTRIGRYTYSAVVEAESDESVIDDNERSAVVLIADSQTRILLIAGQGGWEYQNLVRLLSRDPTFELTCWLQSADPGAVRDGDRVVTHLPALAEELFVYDVILLLDPDPNELDEEWCERIDRFITEHGGGLLYVAGRPFAPSFMRRPEMGRLVSLLPVTPDPDADLTLNRLGHFQRRALPIEVSAESAAHPIMRQGDDAPGTRLAWQGRTLYWHYPVFREKPVATVLMRHGEASMRNENGAHVLSAVQFVGAGRSAFLAFDGTWRWREGDAGPFNRFWVQMLRYLAEGKLFAGDQRGSLSTEGTEFPVGDPILVTARLFTPEFEPMQVDEVAVDVLSQESSVASLRLARRLDQPGVYEGRYTPQAVGSLRFSITPPGGDGAPLFRDARVVRPDIELLHPRLDRASMMSLSALSEKGRYFEVDEIMRIPPLIPDRHEVTTTRATPTTIWDRWWTLAALVALLSAEWAARKWSRLL